MNGGGGGGRMPRAGPHGIESINIVGARWPGGTGRGIGGCLIGVGLGQNGSGMYGSTDKTFIIQPSSSSL